MTRGIYIFILPVLITINVVLCSNHDTSWIENALQNWTWSNDEFYSKGFWSFVGYDYDNDKAIIFGGNDGYSVNYNRIGLFDYNTLYVYDMILDKLTPIQFNWEEISGWLFCNEQTPNAVIIDEIMYFSYLDPSDPPYQDNTQLFSFDIKPIYSYVSNKSQPIPDIQPKPLFPTTAFQGTKGCVVTDSTKQYIIISALHPVPPQKDTSYDTNFIYELNYGNCCFFISTFY